MVPYVAWSAISFLLSGDYTLERVGKMVLYPDTSFWFLWVLFFINVVFIFCQWVAEKVRRDELLVFGFQFLAYYFVFYTIGYCASLSKVANRQWNDAGGFACDMGCNGLVLEYA